jgi:polysaccharide export outer membrane protein
MNFKKFSLAFLVLSWFLVVPAITFAQNTNSRNTNTPNNTQNNTPNDFSYVVGPKDLLEISVFDVPELNITVRVSQDGTITLPLLGQIKVDGLTLSQLERKLKNLLEKNYLKNPQVTIFIKEYQSQQISVIGAINKPGNYELVGKKTLLQVLSTAGGVTEDAAGRIIILRHVPGEEAKTLLVDLEALMISGNSELNIPILSDDIINVPVETFADIYIFGQVNNPGQIKMKKSSSFTLIRAIAQAGGFTERARKSGVVLKRIVEDKEQKIEINVNKILSGKKQDVELNPNDIVFVPESIL